MYLGYRFRGCISSWAPCWVGGADPPLGVPRRAGLDWVIAVFPTSRRMTGQEETSANNLSEDDLWKEKLHSGISGVSKGMPLKTSSSFLLSIWLMMFPHVGLLPEVLFACSMSVWTCLPPGMCVYESEHMKRAEGGPMVSLGACVVCDSVFEWLHHISLARVGIPQEGSVFIFPFFQGGCGLRIRFHVGVFLDVRVCYDHLSKGPASTCLQCACVSVFTRVTLSLSLVVFLR